ncbi:putative saccharopine dehydrogenase (NADP+, L-glutamate-forming) [Rhizoctonia solani 123E]|uniref:Putative saccharopine dehydrogenase (NADP+, L-glutamate-forming) n=1 Tax=Rhizoctonia solani 123E TaxID=1423351 RepID=A0A074S1A4_9AGAM|nr:putative saccharopine dehydrogenase (NADP+, L-glutamate-forming) [Rhizoctonia solani 123E]
MHRTLFRRAEKVIVGLRREDPGRTWERRTPLTPDVVEDLVESGAEVLVEECERRVWRNDDYAKAGAKLVPSGKRALEPADIILGIKEVPIDECISTLTPRKTPRTHLMFSHTAKGQEYNTGLLSQFVSPPGDTNGRARLIDYELLADESGKRVVAFGWFAGAAGFAEGLITSAQAELQLGVASPFINLPRPYAHPSLADMRASLRSVGKHISDAGTSPALGPFVVAVTGNGNVAMGALDMAKELPVVYVKPKDLPDLVSNPETDLRKIYAIHLPPSEYIRGINDEPYNREAYHADPSKWKSIFADEVAPYISLLVNGAGWKHGYPRLISNADLPRVIALAKGVGLGRFAAIADVSCDFEGGLEFVTHATTISEPIYQHDLGPHLMTIEILPAEIPRDASEHFSKALIPYLKGLVRAHQRDGTFASEGEAGEEDRKVLGTLDRATIAENGVLRPQHAWLMERVEAYWVQNKGSTLPKPAVASESNISTSSGVTLSSVNPEMSGEASSSAESSQGVKPDKRVLLLGSGMVAKPAVDVFLGREDIKLVVASNNLSEATTLTQSHDRAEAVHLDVSDRERIAELVNGADVVVSLLPAAFHVQIAEACIKYQKHLVTASYISPTMKALHERAIEADVLLLNEIGLDPGIDHCGAMEMRDRFEREGKRIVSFISWCGGLPAPEDSNVPLGMKFSWSPKALLSAALNPAQFKLAGKQIEIPGNELLESYFPHVPLAKGFALEGLANRDSLGYAETYKLGSVGGMRSLFRGTLRYKGFADLMRMFSEVGLLSNKEEDKIMLSQWNELVGRAAAKASGEKFEIKDTVDVVKSIIGPNRAKAHQIIPVLEWMNAVPTDPRNVDPSLPPVPKDPVTPLDALGTLLAYKLRYEPHERDLVLLSHEVVTAPVSAPSSKKFDPATNEVHTSTLVVYGSTSGSAMSKTVGLPLAFATLRVLDGGVRARGVAGPFGEEIYKPVLEGLEAVGLGMREAKVAGEGMARSMLRWML